MIILSGTPFDINTILNDYPEDSIERQLLYAMNEGNGTYRYDSLEQLRFELNLRKETAEAAKALNRSGLDFAVFQESRCNPDYWDRTANGGFRLKRGANPAAAVRDIFQNGNQYATECATAMIIVYYGALLETYGEERFNKLFPSIYLMNWHDLDPLLGDVGNPRKADDVLIGDRGYFSNPDVNPEFPEWQGENVIVLPDNLYYGHGVGITTANKIIKALNAQRISGARRSAYFLDAVARPDYKNLAKYAVRAEPQRIPLVWKRFPAPITAV